MKKIISFLLYLLVPASFASTPLTLDVWPQGAPDNNELTEPENTNEEGHIANSSEAKLYVYLPARNLNTGTSMLICPGGGYGILAMRHEGHEYAEWLASQGITAAVLKYRMPNGHPGIPSSDARQAMRILRGHASDWEIDPGKTGVSGFSAGGHLASTLGTHPDKSTRPAFMVLFYPVITMTEFTHRGSKTNLLGNGKENDRLIKEFSNEQRVSPDTPPALLLLSDDDTIVAPENSIAFYRSLKKNGIPASMHIFPEGGHGWGMHRHFPYHENWKKLLIDWLKHRQLLGGIEKQD